ncbi:sulfotransferase domain-containing protein [Pseudalkalibacillus hwajinpoensis]|uniref:sulfotransferase domain-containing protein n=1 Tax=Guptibacillus hwajinpoensis TaxID=208199 RepID=UPI00325AB1B1
MVLYNNKAGKLPGFLLNSVPKSGTHLLKQILLGIPETFHIPGKVIYEGLAKDHLKHVEIMSNLQENEFIMGHIYYSKRWADMLDERNIKQVFITRDLRDVIVSMTYFIHEKLPNHPLYETFTQKDKTQKDRYLHLIRGVDTDDVRYGNIASWFNDFSDWLTDSNTLSLTYEELMQSENSRRDAIKRTAEYLFEDLKPSVSLNELVNQMEGNIRPAQSPTFRKGNIGSWKNEFDDEVIEAFKEVAGNLIIQLGYENDSNW